MFHVWKWRWLCTLLNLTIRKLFEREFAESFVTKDSIQLLWFVHEIKENVVNKQYLKSHEQMFFFFSQYNDVAILTLDSPVTFSSAIAPVCLPPMGSTDQFVSKESTVVGWGALREGITL